MSQFRIIGPDLDIKPFPGSDKKVTSFSFAYIWLYTNGQLVLNKPATLLLIATIKSTTVALEGFFLGKEVHY